MTAPKQLELFAPVEAHAERIDKAKADIVNNVLVIGTELAKAHDKLSHHGDGVFGQWVEERCGFSRMSANRYMRAAEVFASGECNKLLQTFDDSAMYLLTAPNAPKDALDNAIERAKAGEKITHKIAKQIVGEFTGVRYIGGAKKGDVEIFDMEAAVLETMLSFLKSFFKLKGEHVPDNKWAAFVQQFHIALQKSFSDKQGLEKAERSSGE